jgi:hypothetical protein
MSQVYEKLPIITPDNRDEYIIAGKESKQGAKMICI